MQRRCHYAAAAHAIAAVGLSPLVLGVHFLPDVLVAAVLGLGYLAITARLTAGEPARTFAIGIAGLLANGGGTRAVVALVGVLGLAVAWQLSERPPVQRFVARVAAAARGDIGPPPRPGA